MKKSKTGFPYLKSLFWVCLAVFIFIETLSITQIIYLDIIHGNPHRSTENATLTMIFVPPLVSLFCIIGVILVFTLPQVLESKLLAALIDHCFRQPFFGPLMALPLTAIITFYCYDYFIPKDFILGGVGPDNWEAHAQGISFWRYRAALIFQAPVTVFNLLYFYTQGRKNAGIAIVSAILILSFFAGMIQGYLMAQNQIKLIKTDEPAIHNFSS